MGPQEAAVVSGTSGRIHEPQDDSGIGGFQGGFKKFQGSFKGILELSEENQGRFKGFQRSFKKASRNSFRRIQREGLKWVQEEL